MSTTACNDACIGGNVDAAARKMLTESFDSDSLTVTPVFIDLGGVPHVRVNVRYQTRYITPGLVEIIEAAGVTSTVTLEATATMQREY
jgi:hypothetical protein